MLNSFQNFSTNGFPIEILSIISAISLLFAILVINSKNPIVSVLFLIGLFLSIASYLFCLGMHFLGMAYLLVYVGAVSILFLFILMLINVRVSELSNSTNNTLSLGFIISILLCVIIYEILPNSIISFNNIVQLIESINVNVVFYVTSVSWDKNLAEVSHITSIGNILYTVYSVLIILTAIILLLAMVGAIAITIKQKTSEVTNEYNLTNNLKSGSIIILPVAKCIMAMVSLSYIYIFSGQDAYNVLNIIGMDVISIDSVFNLYGKDDIMITIEVDVTEGYNNGTPTGTTTTITGGESNYIGNEEEIIIITEVDVSEGGDGPIGITTTVTAENNITPKKS